MNELISHRGVCRASPGVARVYSWYSISFKLNMYIQCLLKFCFNLLMLHSQILATWNSSTNHDIVPWIGEELHIGAEFQEFSRDNTYVRVPGKLSQTHSKIAMFSNPGDKVLKCVKTSGQICPVIKQEIGYCPLDWRTPGLCNGFLTVFQEPWHTCCSWKTVVTPLQCVVFLQSRGQCHD